MLHPSPLLTGAFAGVGGRTYFPGVNIASSSRSHQPCALSCAGVTMKLMDEVAGIVAARHCKTNIVTASVDAINFHDKIRKGKRAPNVRRGWGGEVALWGLWVPGAISLCHTYYLPVCHKKQEDKALCFALHTHLYVRREAGVD